MTIDPDADHATSGTMASTMQDEPTDSDSEAATDASSSEQRETTDPVQVGLEQFQRAALEAIRAGRAMLDAAESVIRDPNAAEAVVRTVGAAARTATETVAGFAAGRWNPPGGANDADPGGDDGDDPPDGGFERISVG